LTLSTWIEDGRIRPVLDRIYPPGQAADAHRRVETEQRTGIVVLSMQEWLQ
jgi:NADPH:quinone reductase-like Zn-dependent oxidoreductase